MSFSLHDDPTIPPPGRRTGKGADSVVPYLKKTLASKPKAQDRDETRTGLKPVARSFDRDDDNPGYLDLAL